MVKFTPAGKKQTTGVGGSFLSILMEFLTDMGCTWLLLTVIVVWKNVISDVAQGNTIGPLRFILYACDILLGLKICLLLMDPLEVGV